MASSYGAKVILLITVSAAINTIDIIDVIIIIIIIIILLMIILLIVVFLSVSFFFIFHFRPWAGGRQGSERAQGRAGGHSHHARDSFVNGVCEKTLLQKIITLER